jgi:hypothetical protein
MRTLHIEHEITDLETWVAAFNRFAEDAGGFLGFLENQVWKIRENSPGLAGTPETMILEPVAT